MNRLELIIDSDIENASLVAVAVNRVCTFLGLDTVKAGEVELCIAEAVTNAIKHAYLGVPGNRVSVAITSADDHINFVVTENGRPIPFEHVQRLIHGADTFNVDVKDVDLLPEGGRGLQIIHDLMDSVAYTSDNEINHLRLTKQIPRHRE